MEWGEEGGSERSAWNKTCNVRNVRSHSAKRGGGGGGRGERGTDTRTGARAVLGTENVRVRQEPVLGSLGVETGGGGGSSPQLGLGNSDELVAFVVRVRKGGGRVRDGGLDLEAEEKLVAEGAGDRDLGVMSVGVI